MNLPQCTQTEIYNRQAFVLLEPYQGIRETDHIFECLFGLMFYISVGSYGYVETASSPNPVQV